MLAVYRTLPSKTRRAVLAVGSSLALLVAGCGGSNSDRSDRIEVPCPSISYFAMEIAVIDAVTRAVVTNAQGLAIDRDFRAELVRLENRLLGPSNRAGAYTVIVRAPGYRDWIREGIEGPLADPCPRSVELVAELVPL